MIQLIALVFVFAIFLMSMTQRYAKKAAKAMYAGHSRVKTLSFVGALLISSLYMIAVVGTLLIRNPYLFGR